MHYEGGSNGPEVVGGSAVVATRLLCEAASPPFPKANPRSFKTRFSSPRIHPSPTSRASAFQVGSRCVDRLSISGSTASVVHIPIGVEISDCAPLAVAENFSISSVICPGVLTTFHCGGVRCLNAFAWRLPLLFS